MNKLKSNFSSLETLLFFAVFIFPMTIIFRSLALNILTVIISFLLVTYMIKNKKLYLFKDNIIKYVIIFFLYIIINSFINYQNPEYVLKSIANFRYLFITLSVFCVLDFINRKNLNTFVFFNLLLIIFICTDIFYQYFSYSNLFGFSPGMCNPDLTKCVRFSGIFGDELIAGSYLSQMGLLFFFLLQKYDFKKKINLKILKILFIFLIFVTILVSGERTALLIFILSIAFYYLLNKKLLKIIILSVIFFSILIVSSKNFSSINDRFLKALETHGLCQGCTLTQNIYRNPWIYHYIAATELFFEKPVFGHGLKSFRTKCHETSIQKKMIFERRAYKDYQACSSHPHNYAFEFLSEYGIVGLLLFIGFIVKILFETLRITKFRKSEEILISIGIGAIILAILFPLKPSGSFLTTFNSSILFYLLGFFLYFSKQKK